MLETYKVMTSSMHVDVAYLVLDIRNSNQINNYIKNFQGDESIIEFYKEFTKLCSQIAVKKHGAWFKKQIGDRLDFAWDKKDLDKAIAATLELYEKCNGNFIKYYPEGIRIGVGIATGKVIFDKKFNELKGDCPRIATILQEKKRGMYIAQEKVSTLPVEYTLIPVPSSLRGEINYAYQIAKKKHRKRLRALNTKSFLKNIEGIAQDMHYHAEGGTLGNAEMVKLIEDSVHEIENSVEKSSAFKRVTGRDIQDIKSRFISKLAQSPLNQATFTFDEFLSKLFTAKACLASSEENAGRFMKNTLNTLLSVTPTFSVGLTPSVPTDFPYLDRDKWNDEICNAFVTTLKSRPHYPIRPTFILETKRQHLNSDVYIENLKLLCELKKRVPQVQLAIGIGDDAEKPHL